MKDTIVKVWTTFKADFADTWGRTKIFLLAVAGLLIALEFQKIKEFLLVYLSKRDMDKAEKQDKILSEQENTQNAQADALVKEANDLANQNKPVDDNWYKK